MKAKLLFVFSIATFFTGFYGIGQQDYWKPLLASSKAAADVSNSTSIYSLDTATFAKALEKVAPERPVPLLFPDLDGEMTSYDVRETPVLHSELAKKYPYIRSFTGVAQNGGGRIKFSFSHKGIQAILLRADDGSGLVLEKQKGSASTYRLFKSTERAGKNPFQCFTKTSAGSMALQNIAARSVVDDRVLRKYRLAVSVTGEYTDYHGGTVADALAAINATVTRVNSIFETDLAVTLELVPNNDSVIYTDSQTDPYSTEDDLNAQVQNTLTNLIGEANYDVGHLFHRDGESGGNAGSIGSVCRDGFKGAAFASALEPEGDLFDVDFVAHELGHQFGANHTWSFRSEISGVQAEPGSGTTIMGYAGITQENDVAPSADDYFHYNSIVQIQEYLSSTSCADEANLANNPPVILPRTNYAIPVGTAFVLSGSATDRDGDILTYTWEQIDDGIITNETFGPENTTGANFRSLPPSTNAERYFPRLSRIVSGDLVQEDPTLNSAWETVSNVARTLNFALTVRDNNPEGGQVATNSIRVDVVDGAGPFRVTSQATATTYDVGSVQTVTWDVADTDKDPINVQEVDLYLSVDGGASFPFVLAENQANTGSTEVQLPAEIRSTARILVKAHNSIFLAVNDAEFSIDGMAALDFEGLRHSVCASTSTAIPFTYETFNGFSEAMTLSVTNEVPFTTTFSEEMVSAGGTAVNLVLSDMEEAPPGTYVLNVAAQSPSLTLAVPLEVTVFTEDVETIALTAPGNGATGVVVGSEFTWETFTNYESYDIELALDENFNAVVDTATVTVGSYQSDVLLPGTEYYWRVRPRNACIEGDFGTAFGFTTAGVSCSRYLGNNLPLAISASGTPTISATVDVDTDAPISNVLVSVGIRHTYVSDLILSLTSPAGTTITLVSNRCGQLEDIDVVFDDNGSPLSCSETSPAIEGLVRPLNPLSTFDGESARGQWTLTINDVFPDDGGTLDRFFFEICTEQDASTFPADNFSVATASTSCRGSNDGSVSVQAQDGTINYSATLVGEGYANAAQFSEQFDFSGLAPGNYSLCVNGNRAETNFLERCFELVIGEPQELGVSATFIGSSNALQLLMSGGELYTIELNGISQQTREAQWEVGLRPGFNTLKVSTERTCQGVFEQSFFVGDSTTIDPNPTGGVATVYSQFHDGEVALRIYSAAGHLVLQRRVEADGTSFDIDVSNFANGLYYLVLEADGRVQRCKMVKE